MLIEAPSEIRDSLARFRAEHPDPAKVAFIMMRFGTTRLHHEIVEAIRTVCATHGLSAFRADDRAYSDDLFPNVMTYMHGCGLGIAVFERLQTDDFNPNVSLEVGYMRALQKPVCLLKDQTLATLPTDLLGRLYTSFDPQDPGKSVPPALTRWLTDRNLVPSPREGEGQP